MNRYILCIALLFSWYYSDAQKPHPRTTGFEVSTYSHMLSETRIIWVHIPATHEENEKFPVVYLFDGDGNFDDVVTMTEFMSNAGLCPPLIVVGILHPDRLKDLTFGTDHEMPGVIGNGNTFMQYIQSELIPYVDSAYPTAGYNMLMGHSAGGLTVLNALIHHPNLFNAYISLDAALWWDREKIVNEAKITLANTNYSGKTLFMALANRMEKNMDTAQVKNDTSEATELIRSNFNIIKEILKNQANKLRFKYGFYADDDHSSVRFIGEYDALRFIFDYYKLKIYNSQLQDSNFKLDSLLRSHYNNISARMGYVIKPNESQVNNLAYFTLRQKQFARSEALFMLNVSNYPADANCYDGLGDLYIAMGDKQQAISYFKMALALKAIPETKQKLDALLHQK